MQKDKAICSSFAIYLPRLTRSCSRNAPVGISRPCARLSYVAYQQLRKCQTHRLSFTYSGLRFRTSLGYGLCSVPSSSLATFALHTPKAHSFSSSAVALACTSHTKGSLVLKQCSRTSFRTSFRYGYALSARLIAFPSGLHTPKPSPSLAKLTLSSLGSRNKKASRPNILNPSKNLLSQPRI